MSKKGDYKVGDRVEAPDKKQGTVQFVGKVHWTKGIWVGVAFDEAVGKHDGVDHKKRYFKCKPKHGVMQKASYWKKVTEKKKKGGKKDVSVSTGKKRKGGKKGKKHEEAPATPEKTPEPKKPPVVTVDAQIQTEPPEEEISKQYLCKLISRMMTDQLNKAKEERDKFQKQLIEIGKEHDMSKSEVMQLQYDNKMKAQEIEKLKDSMEELQLTNEDLRVQNEMYKLDIEEANEKLEDNFLSYRSSLNMDEQKQAEILRTNDLLKETIENLFKSGIDAISEKDKRIHDLTMDSGYMGTLSERVKQLLGVEREVVQLRSEVKELTDTLESLQDAERMVKQLTEANNELEGELQDWRDYVVDVDAERQVLEDLHTENEALIQELRNYGQRISADFSALQKKYSQKDIEISDLQKELFKLRNEVAEINSAQQSGLEFAEITSAVDTGGIDTSVTTGGMAGSALTSPRGGAGAGGDGIVNAKQLQIIINENVSLKGQLAQIRNILIRSVDRVVDGRSDYVHRNILSLYFPKTLKIDNGGINALKTLSRVLCKAGMARDLLERFYADPSSASLKNPNLARQAHYLCPLILEQENHVRALTKGLLSCETADTWKPVVNEFSKLSNVEKPYSVLLEHINSSKLEDYDDGDLSTNKKVLSEFVKKHFSSYDIEKDQKDEDRVEKPKVLLMMSETHYRFQSLSLRLNEFNSKMHKIVHAPAQTTKTITEKIFTPTGGDASDKTMTFPDMSPTGGGASTGGLGTIGDGVSSDAKDDDSKADEPIAPLTLTALGSGRPGLSRPGSARPGSARPVLIQDTVNAAISSLKIGVIEKMLRLRQVLLEHLKEIISKSQPIDLGYRTKYISLSMLTGANRTQLKYLQLKVCKSDARKAVTRIDEMLKKLEPITAAMAPKERVSKINRILEDEEEHNKDGLLNVLESALSNVRSVKGIVDSAVNSTLRSTDELPDLTSEERGNMEESKTFPVWELFAADIRDKIDEAGKIRVDMEKTKQEMKNQKEEVFQTLKTVEEQRNIILTIQKQREQESQKVTDLAESQKRTAFLEKENKKLVALNEKLDKENKEQQLKIRENSELIKKYKKSMEKIKDKQMLGSKPSTRTLESLDTSFGGHRSRGNSRATDVHSRQLGHRSLSPHPKSPQGQRRSFALGGGASALPALGNHGSNNLHSPLAPLVQGATQGNAGAIARAMLGVGAANALTYYDEEDMSYSELLQETIQTLRRKVSQLTMKNKLINVELNLKPLPLVSIKNILNDGKKKDDDSDKDKQKNDESDTKEREKKKRTRTVRKKVTKRVKKVKKTDEEQDGGNKEDDDTVTTEKKDETGNDSEYEDVEVETDVEEEVTDDESDDNDNNGFDFAKKLKEQQAKLLKKKNDEMTNALKDITGELNYLRATPQIIDIARKSYGGQDVIGRQFKLRDIRLKYLNLKEDIRKNEEEAVLEDDGNSNQDNELSNLNKKLGIVLGKVSIPSSSTRHQNVVIAPQKLDEFQHSFL